jgi:hypothetical protein
MSGAEKTPESVHDLRSVPKRYRRQIRAEVEREEGGRIRREAEAVGRLDAASTAYEADRRNLERAILAAREAGVTLEEIAGVVGWSKERVRRIEQRAHVGTEA